MATEKLDTSLEGSWSLYFFHLSGHSPHYINMPKSLLSTATFYILLSNYIHQYSTETFKSSIDLWHLIFSYDPLSLIFDLLVACEVVECSACSQHMLFILSTIPFSSGFLLLWPFLFNCPCWLLFLFPTQCQCRLDWAFHFLHFSVLDLFWAFLHSKEEHSEKGEEPSHFQLPRHSYCFTFCVSESTATTF